jgi:4-hydroxy-tetrahydrodipicolinate synthase
MGYKTTWFRGIFPPLVTPFTPDDRVDEEAYRQLIRRLLPHVNGFVPGGTTGEFSYLTTDERKRIIEVCLDEVDGRVPVLAGTGAPATRDALALTEWARDAGVSGALIVAPYYLKPSFNEVYDHFSALNRLGLPIVLYNIPQCAGTDLRWWTAEGLLLDMDNVVGIKDSSGDVRFLEALLEKVKGKVSIFVGHDEAVLPALAAGADGAIVGSANLVPDVWQTIYRAVQEGDLATARQWQEWVQPLARVVAGSNPAQAVKKGLEMMGLPLGDARRPILPGGGLRWEDYAELRAQLEGLGKIPPVEVRYDLGDRQVRTRLPAIPQTPRAVSGWDLRVGSGVAGPPPLETARVELMLGRRDGPVGRAIARTQAGWGQERGLRVINERPLTLLTPALPVGSARHSRLVYENAADGVNLAIRQSIESGFLPDELLDDLALIVAVSVNPAATIARRVTLNHCQAAVQAIRRAVEGEA